MRRWVLGISIGVGILASQSPVLASDESGNSLPNQQMACVLPTPEQNEGFRRLQEGLLTDGAKIDFGSLSQSPLFAEMHALEEQRKQSDWAYLCRYRAENALAAEKPAPQVVFIGDSITENWVLGDPALFRTGFVGRGISGQTSPQVLLRFQQDVVRLRPRTVHIMVGTNDIAGNTGPTTDLQIQENIRAMVAIAKANRLQVVLGSILPATSFAWQPDLKPAERIRRLNAWLRDFAQKNCLIYADYHSALSDSSGGLLPRFSNDGVHPNRAGYAAMREVAVRAIGLANGSPKR